MLSRLRPTDFREMPVLSALVKSNADTAALFEPRA
jgi:hypothetical protein